MYYSKTARCYQHRTALHRFSPAGRPAMINPA
nr:MAG TPA: hypothetical protein [Caudoviricetes sp.]